MQLVVNTYGAYIHVKDNLIKVEIESEGRKLSKSFSPNKISSILLSKHTAVSGELVSLCLTYNIDILFSEDDGTPIARIWHSKLGSTSKIRKMQLLTSVTSEWRNYIREWLTAKLSNRIVLLKDLKKHRSSKKDIIESTINKIDSYKILISEELRTGKPDKDKIRGFEGSAGKEYFTLLGELLPDDYKFENRSYRPAQDPFNAMLNYCYGILYSKIEKSLILAGIDPYLGFFHRDDYNQKSMVFDFIEPYRVYAEEVVFKLFSSKKIKKSFFEKTGNGITIEKEGKQILIENFSKYFSEVKIRYKNKNRKRENILQLEAHTFAKKMLKEKFDEKEVDKIDLLGDV